MKKKFYKASIYVSGKPNLRHLSSAKTCSFSLSSVLYFSNTVYSLYLFRKWLVRILQMPKKIMTNFKVGNKK